MKLLFSFLKKITVVVVLTFTVSCNSSDQSGENGEVNLSTNHNPKEEIIPTDTTRTATSGIGNDVNSNMSDTGFISKNIMDNLKEIQLSKVGRDKGTDASIKKLATQMVSDHTNMLNDLKALALKKGTTINSDKILKMTSMGRLGNATGEAFDKLWTTHMLTIHETKIAELQNFVNTTGDADLKVLATASIEKIKSHRNELLRINTAIQ